MSIEFAIPSISNKSVWEGTINIKVASDGSEYDASSIQALKVSLRDPRTNAEIFSGTLGGKVTAVDASRGMFEFQFPVGSFTDRLSGRDLPGSFLFSGLITMSDGLPRQLFQVNVPAYEGAV